MVRWLPAAGTVPRLYQTAQAYSVSCGSVFERMVCTPQNRTTSSPRNSVAMCLPFAALLLLTVQNTALVLCTKLSFRESAEPYLVSSVILASEVLKLLSSGMLSIIIDGKPTIRGVFGKSPSGSLRFAVPSLLYVIQNSLLFEGVRLLQPVVYIACSQSKILTSAFFSVLVLNTSVTRAQFFAIVLLIIGMVMVQFDSSASENTEVTDRNAIRGLLAVIIAATTSGYAGAHLEKIYKEVGARNQVSIWFRNLQLAVFSVPIAYVTSSWQSTQSEITKFEGFDCVVIFVVFLQAIGGLITAAVMRYASNILKCFAVSISICNCALATPYLLENESDNSTKPYQLCGIGLVIAATFMFGFAKT